MHAEWSPLMQVHPPDTVHQLPVPLFHAGNTHLCVQCDAWICEFHALCAHAGDGSVDHLDDAVELPGMLELKDGTYTIGRSAPADLVIGVPTVSAKHAELTVGELDDLIEDTSSSRTRVHMWRDIEGQHLGHRRMRGRAPHRSACRHGPLSMRSWRSVS